MAFAPKKKTSKVRSKRRTSNWVKLVAKKLKNRVGRVYREIICS